MREHPDEENRRVSHETIYRSLFIQTRGALKKELQAYLRAALRVPSGGRVMQHLSAVA